MTHYRIYSLNDANRIVKAEDIEYEDDQAAAAEAHARHGDLARIEIWSGTRRLNTELEQNPIILAHNQRR